jgi:hypothetical protein
MHLYDWVVQFALRFQGCRWLLVIEPRIGRKKIRSAQRKRFVPLFEML